MARAGRATALLACLGLAAAAAHRPAAHATSHHRAAADPAPAPDAEADRARRHAAGQPWAERHAWELWCSAALLAAGFVQGVAGFGGGMTSMAIVPAKLPLMDAVPVVALFALFVTAVLAVQLRGQLGSPRVRAALRSLLAGAAVGVPLGVGLLTAADPRLLRIALGVAMLCFVVERVASDVGQGGGSAAAAGAAPRRPEYDPLPTCGAAGGLGPEPAADRAEGGAADGSPRALLLPASAAGEAGARRAAEHRALAFAAGLTSGMLGGALNEAGPPVVIYFAVRGWGKDETKAALSFYFVAVSALSVAMLAYRGILTARHAYYAAVALPAAALGVALGVRVYDRLDARVFGRVVVGALLVAGLAYVGSASAELLLEG